MPDVRLLVLENDATDPVARLGAWFEECGATLEVVRAHLGEPVPTTVPPGVDGVVPLGGGMNCEADDRHPWLADERALLRDAVEREVPVLGVCLGGQLLAVALGGAVGRATPGEVGLSEIHPTAQAAADPLAVLLPATTPVAQFHEDEVQRLPAGAVLLAGNDDCRHQVWRVGPSAWALQGHPEVDGTIMAGWVADDPEHLSRCGTDAARVVQEVTVGEDAVERAWRPVAAAFVERARAAAPPSG